MAFRLHITNVLFQSAAIIYCGSELLSLGYKGQSNNTLYLCKSVRQPDEMRVCQKTCITSKGNSSCEGSCISEGHYCGNEFSITAHDTNGLYSCLDGSHVPLKQCSRRCTTREAGTSYCDAECEPGRLYCGYELETIGFDANGSNNVYLCRNSTSIELLKTCNIKCETGQRAHCSEQCTLGLMYCGHELREAGFSGAKENALYLCTASQAATEAQECPSSCIPDEENSICAPANLALDVPICGTSTSDSTVTYVRGGEASRRDAYPWMVSLRNSSGSHHCSGVLISPQWVLTAAHCVENKHGPFRWIIVGEYKLHEYDKGQVNVSVERVFPYQMYKSTNMQTGDLALVRLSRQLSYSRFVQPACLPLNVNDIVQPNTRCAVAGWGAVLRDVYPDRMQHGLVEVFEHEFCANKFKRGFDYNSSVMICAGARGEGHPLPCHGDSGGPLLCKKPDALSWVVHGIVSYGFSDACRKTLPLPSVFTNVATFVQWIHETMDQQNGTGSTQRNSA